MLGELTDAAHDTQNSGATVRRQVMRKHAMSEQAMGRQTVLSEQAFSGRSPDGRATCEAVRNDAEPVSPLSNPDANTGTAVLERPQTEEQTSKSDDGDADRFAHYVSKDRIMESRMTGRPVVALCGKIWVPRHDPSQYPVCPDCKRIYEEMTGK
jgi:hypothetical protein